jgi:hypothetical protein
MSLLQVLGSGIEVATRLVPLVFAVGAGAAQAQLPRPVPAVFVSAAAAPAPDHGAVPAVIEPLPGFAPLTLASNRVEIHVGRERAEVRTRLTYRNDGPSPIEAHYAVPLQATLLQQSAGETIDGEVDADTGCGSSEADTAVAAADGDPLAHEFAEAGEPDPRALQAGTLWIAPGDSVTVEMRRPADLFKRAGRVRLVLPLIVDRQATFTPEFSADVLIDAGAPVLELSSATHGGQVSGLGERIAVLNVPNGRVYEGQFLAVEFALGNPADARTAPLAQAIEWHGEGRALRRPPQ